MKKMWSVLTGMRDSYPRILAPLMIMLCIGVAATSCKDSLTDADPENPTTGGKTVPAGTKLYAYIRLVQADGMPTRAGEGDDTDSDTDDNTQPDPDDKYGGDKNNDYDADFEPGDQENESKIDNLLFIFYDADGDYVAHYKPTTGNSNSYKDNDQRKPSSGDGMVLDKDDKGDEDKTNDEDVIIEEIGWETLIKVEVETKDEITDFNDKIEGGSYLVVLNYNEGLLEDLGLETNSEGELTATPKTRDEAIEVVVKNYQLSETVTGEDGKTTTTPKGFLMTTAGHFHSGKDGDADNDKYLWYDKVPEGNEGLYESQTKAIENPLIAYVERVASRIEFEIDTEKIEPIEVLYGETDVYRLWFNPDGWAVEAQEKTSYLNKKLEFEKKSSSPPTTNETYPSDFADWIDYKSNRIFWAKSISFSGENHKYPVYGDQYIKDGNGKEKNIEMALRYVTFGDILESPVQKLVTTNANTGVKSPLDRSKDISQGQYQQLTGMDYVLEHTFAKTEWDHATNPYAVPTSAVLRGRYTATFKKTDERPDPYPDGKKDKVDKPLEALKDGFYIRYVDMERTDRDPELGDSENERERYQYHLYLKDDGLHEIDYEMLTAMLKEQFVIWTKDENDELIPVKDNTSDVFAILNAYQRYVSTSDEYHLDLDEFFDKFIPSSNAYTLQIKKDANLTNLYLKTSKEMDPEEITSANIEKANKALLKQLGYAQYYWQAYAFFYAPIPHYAGNEDPFIKKVDGEKKSTYTGLFNYQTEEDGNYTRDEQTGNYIVDHKTGDFGVVRNHIYNIKINKISNLGYGIPGEDVIPLPEPRPDHKLYQFDLELKVLPWNQFKYTFDI